MERLAAAIGDGGLDGGARAGAGLSPTGAVAGGQAASALFGDNEAVKCALAANLSYFHDDPATLWWVPFAMAQGSFLLSGARFVQGGSQRLSSALARAIRDGRRRGAAAPRRQPASTMDGAGGVASRHPHRARRQRSANRRSARRSIGNAAPATLAALMPEARARSA